MTGEPSSSTFARRPGCAAPSCSIASASSASTGACWRRAGAAAARSARRGRWPGIRRCRFASSSVRVTGRRSPAPPRRWSSSGRVPRPRLPQAAALVTDALLADLPDGARAAADALGTLAATAPDVADLIDALVPLASALRYGDVRGSDSVALTTVVDEVVVRVIAGLERALPAPRRRCCGGDGRTAEWAAGRVGDARPRRPPRRPP